MICGLPFQESPSSSGLNKLHMLSAPGSTQPRPQPTNHLHPRAHGGRECVTLCPRRRSRDSQGPSICQLCFRNQTQTPPSVFPTVHSLHPQSNNPLSVQTFSLLLSTSPSVPGRGKRPGGLGARSLGARLAARPCSAPRAPQGAAPRGSPRPGAARRVREPLLPEPPPSEAGARRRLGGAPRLT